MLRTVLMLAVAVAIPPTCLGSEQVEQPPPILTVPYVASDTGAVRDMLWLAGVGEGDVVFDLGSGDGRVVIAAVRDFHAQRAVGIEIDPDLVRQSRAAAAEAGVADRTEFIRGDLFQEDCHGASVVALFLGHNANLKLRPRIVGTLKPGTRVVSHQFGMGEWKPDKSLSVRTVAFGMHGEMWNPFQENPHVPDFFGNERHHGGDDKIHMWLVPAHMAGIWRGSFETEAGPRELRLVLHQRLSGVNGSFRFDGWDNSEGGVGSQLNGDRLRMECRPGGAPFGSNHLLFDARLQGDTMRGTLSITENGKLRETEWEARREEADFRGTWEWPCATGERTVGLRIERRDGELAAIYLDRGQEIPVADFYDWGGGFYFTLLVGKLDDSSVRITEDTGWLIGEAIAENGRIKGRIEFYPWGTDGEKAAKPVLREWEPRLVRPMAESASE